MGTCLPLLVFRLRRKASIWAIFVLLTLPVSGGSEIAQRSDGVYRVGSEKQLFIDDLLIERSKNVVLTMNPPVKTAERSVVSEYAWEEFSVGAWGTVMEDEGIYKMWYEGTAFDDGEIPSETAGEEALH